MRRIHPPEMFRNGKINEFLKSIEFIFELENKLEADFHLDLRNVKEMKLIGQLLVYKFISYTVSHRCFANPKLYWNNDNVLQEEFQKSGFLDIMNTYIKTPKNQKNILKSYQSLKIESSESVLFAPTRLLREEEDKRILLESDFIDQIEKFYCCEKKTSIINICLGELLSNFWSHATEETNTIMVAQGKGTHFEICLADNGNGIISTLNKSKSTPFKNNIKTLESSLKKGVTSKMNTDHMGSGLFYISEIVKYNNGNLDIFSEGSYIHLNPKKIESGDTGFWKGTIIYLRLDLSHPIPISKIKNIKYNNDIGINWG